MLARAWLGFAVLATVLWMGCSTAPVVGGPKKIVARFTLASDGGVPRFLDVPWPSDVYLSQGHIVDPIPGFDGFVTSNATSVEHELGKLDGFSRIAHAFFAIDDLDAPALEDGSPAIPTIDAASLPSRETDCAGEQSSVFLVDLAAKDATSARVPCRAEWHDDTKWGAVTRPLLAVGPARGIVLEEGHAYAAVLTDRVRDASGRHVAASVTFGSARGAKGLYGDAIAKIEGLLGPALSGAHVVAIAPYTTHTRARELFDLRDSLEAMPVPKLGWDAAAMAPMGTTRFARPVSGQLPAGFTASLDDWLGVVDAKDRLANGTDDPANELPVRAHDKIAAFGSAAFDAVNFLLDKGGYANADHATFARDPSGKIIPSPTRPTQRIWVSIAVPDAPMPASGYPVVIVQHGMSASREYFVQLMNVLAARGWVGVAIDSITFGARAPEPEYQVDLHTDYEKAPGAKYAGPDGIADDTGQGRNGPIDLFGQLSNLGAFRDQLRHAAIDTAQLVRVLRSNPDLSTLAVGAVVPKLDPNAIVYLGESLGSIEGETAAAIEPNLRAWGFSVGGGGIILEAATHGPALGSLIGAGASINWHFYRDHFSESHPFVNLVQTIVEPADPLIYAPNLVRAPRAVAGKPAAPRNVLLLEVLYDELVANEAAEAFARAAGMPLASPNVGSNSGTIDLRDPSKNLARVPLAVAMPDVMGVIHDTPMIGVTAVVVQAGPAAHGYDIVSRTAKHSYAAPYVRPDAPVLFQRLDKDFSFANPYLELQETFTRFFGSAFSQAVPGAVVIKAPVRDFDGDGSLDDIDPAPSDPNVK